ncbi:GGDEF domain-containing protein [Hydrogenimonas urashimensis]|uniref:GGDEF domain-containing protein n=1 Tax=Hydrogenimonas urashimensis TaxID=2740515 RepID=UPI0022AB1349|nr:diguanylate cyclase [Hydrogenimonas urashimensis]
MQKDEIIAGLEKDLSDAQYKDAITRAWNYPMFARKGSTAAKRVAHERKPISLVVVELTNLDSINMRYTVKTGDMVMKGIADLIKEESRSKNEENRPSDIIGRWNGPGLLVLLPHCDECGVRTFIERIDKRIASRAFSHKHQTVEVHLSYGACTQYGRQASIGDLIKKAEVALESAKTEKLPFRVVDHLGDEAVCGKTNREREKKMMGGVHWQ